jgi:hypothetical protein
MKFSKLCNNSLSCLLRFYRQISSAGTIERQVVAQIKSLMPMAIGRRMRSLLLALTQPLIWTVDASGGSTSRVGG